MKNVRFDFVRYANCWEDDRVLRKSLAIKPGESVLSILSAGDNSLALLLDDPARVLAVDISPAQFALVDLKKAAIRHLDREEFLAFWGFLPSPNRIQTMSQLLPELEPGSRTFWEGKGSQVAAGLLHAGKFESYFQRFRQYLLPLVHEREAVHALLSPKSAENQLHFYQDHWNSFRWRSLFRVFFSRQLLGLLGRDPAFLDQVEVPVGDFLFRRAEAELQSVKCQSNAFLRRIFLGDFTQLLPEYLQEGKYEIVQQRLERLEIRLGAIQDFLDAEPAFHAFNLSNIFEYMSEAVFRSLSVQLSQAAFSGARFAYWNLMVPRFMANLPETGLLHQLETAKALSLEDQGFFYRHFLLDMKP